VEVWNARYVTPCEAWTFYIVRLLGDIFLPNIGIDISFYFISVLLESGAG
jgi:hypothetical protein